jgi:dTDP-glucose 4,6-dehydratase
MAYSWQDRPVLVTGAGGFIGSRLVNDLVQKGARVKAFVRYNSRGDAGLLKLLSPDVLTEIALIGGDLRDPQAVEDAIAGVETVFHLGALISIPYSYFHPVEVVDTNISGTLNVLLACRKLKCKLIHTSTSEVYGTALRVPIDENHPLQGQSPYSASKIGADKLVESFQRSFGVPAVTVRPFNTYGPGQSARAVIPTIISQALTRDVILLGNLDTKRDFTFVEDTVCGFIKAAEAEGVYGEVFNLGTGSEVTIGELAGEIVQLIGKDVPIKIDEQRLRPENSEVMRLLSDNRKAKDALGWQPQISIRDGLKITIDWIGKHIEMYRPGRYEL